MNSNYLVNVTCPHCQSKLLVAISGFGSELSVREKWCKKCDNVFYTHIMTVTTAEESIRDGQISGVRDRIAYLRRERRRLHFELSRQLLTEIESHREGNKIASLARNN